MLQSLLQPRDNQLRKPKMIGAMPAVAVRHERRRAEKRGGGRRPSQLALQLGRTTSPQTSPSPMYPHENSDFYVCGKFLQVAALHAVVGSLLLGIVILVVGLVQLSPGAEAAQHRYYLMGSGGALVGVGILGAFLRCFCLHLYNRRMRDVEEYEEEDVENITKNGVSVVESGHANGRKAHVQVDTHKAAHEKPRLKSQTSVGSPPKPTRTKDMDTLIKQPSATSDT